MIDVDQYRHELNTGLPYLAELVFRVAAATTDAPNAEIPGGQALYMTGPSADPEAFGNRGMSIIMERLTADAIETERPGDPPAVGYWLNDWESDVRTVRDDEPLWALDNRAPFSIRYLVERVDWMLTEIDGELQYPPVLERHAQLRHLIRRLEDCIHDGIRDDTGAPCELCGRALVKEWAGNGEPVADDHWLCRHCDRVLTVDEYVAQTRRRYLANADALTSTDMVERFPTLKSGSLRGWASKGQVRKVGADESGRALYSVSDVSSRLLVGNLTEDA